MAEEVKFVQPKPIEVEVQKMDGSMVKLQCPRITADMMHAIGEASKLADKNADRALCMQMAIFFGGEHKDYREYDTRVVTQVIMWMTEQIRNPT
jgi:hypothetical protein